MRVGQSSPNRTNSVQCGIHLTEHLSKLFDYLWLLLDKRMI